MEVKKGKRELIIEAAVRVFSTKGYHNTRMEEIALEAGVGKGTIYEYFSSKLHLFQEMMEESVRIYSQKLISFESESISFAEKIFLLLEGHIQFCKENKELTRIVFWDTEIFDEELKEWALIIRREKEGLMNEAVQKAIDDGELKEINPRLITLLIGGVLGSLWAPITLEDWDVDAGELAQQITDVIMNGVGV